MRSLLRILITLAVLVGGFVVYLLVQPRSAVSQAPLAGSAAPAGTFRDNPQEPLGTAQDIHLKSFSDTGQLVSEFTADRFEPRKDDTVLVQQPCATFYLSRGQRLVVSGRDGVVTMPQGPDANATLITGKSTGAAAAAQPPSRGVLHDVHVRLFAADQSTTPALTIDLPNAAFDNDTFRLYTEAYRDEHGNFIDADQVPVKVYGDEYQFTGRGLTIRWNELRDRLEELDIAHGDQVLIRNPAMLRQSFKATVGERPAAPAGDTGAAGAALTGAADAVPELPNLLYYRAVFHDAVEVMQGDQPVATADQMQVDLAFDQGHSSSATTSASAPGPQPAQAAAQPTPAVAQPATAAAQPAPAARESAESLLGDRPVTIRWKGLLRVQPTAPGADSPPADQAVVELTGGPVVLHSREGRIGAAVVRYRTIDNMATLDSGPAMPVTLDDGRGDHVTTPRMEFYQAENRAVLSGPGQADLQVKSAPSDVGAEPLHARWADRCELKLAAPSAGGDLAIEHGRLDGDVRVQHPRLSMGADHLDLDFASPTETAASEITGAPASAPTSAPPSAPTARSSGRGSASPILRSLVADGNVNCQITQGDRSRQQLQAGHAQLAFATDAQGNLYPHQVQAHGGVVAESAGQQFRAADLDLTMLPAPADGLADSAAGGRTSSGARRDDAMPQLVLRHLDASGGVHAQNEDDHSTLDAARVEIDDDPAGQRLITITGAQQLARLVSGDQVLSGGLIRIDPAAQNVTVTGPGVIHGVLRSDDTREPARPVDASWKDRAQIDVARGTGVLEGDVTAWSVSADGLQTYTAFGDRADLLLADARVASGGAAASQRAVETATTAPANGTTRPSAGAAAPALADVLKNFAEALRARTARQIGFSGHARLVSEQRSDGKVVRAANLSTDAFRFSIVDQQFIVPGPGQMLLEDSRPTTRPARTSADASAATGAGAASAAVSTAQPLFGGDFDQLRGKLAMRWEGRLVVQPLQGADQPFGATLSGGVKAAFEPQTDASRKIDFRADTLAADFRRASGAARRSSSSSEEFELRRVVATGSVQFADRGESGKVEFAAARLQYDPAGQAAPEHPPAPMVVASGTDAAPAELVTPQGSRVRFRELWWNLQTQQIDKLVGLQGTARP